MNNELTCNFQKAIKKQYMSPKSSFNKYNLNNDYNTSFVTLTCAR